jgi:hypothetical protein
MKQINSLEELKNEATVEDGGYADFFIILNGGARSSKQISYNPHTNRFDVINEIDFSYQDNLSEKQLANKTHIVVALDRGALYKC